jgi:membrane fusion protein (multidrug efflux system)
MSTPVDPGHAAEPGNAQTTTPAPEIFTSRRWVVIGVAGVIGLLLAAACFVVPRLHWESTDDAYVQAHLTTVTAKVPAYVQALHVDDNDRVTAGELLLELDPRDYAVQVDVARANLASAKSKRKEADTNVSIADAAAVEARAELQVAQANAMLAASNLNRVQSVSDARAVSNERIDTAVAAAEGTGAAVTAARTKVQSALAAAELARAQVTTAAAAVAQAQAALAQTELNLSYTKISVAQSGTIANKLVAQGNYVQPGQALLSIVPTALFVIANFKETQLANMHPGQAAIVHVDAYPRLELKGHVDSLQRGTGSVFALLPPENATGNFVKVVQRVPVKIVFDDPDEAVRRISPGMSVEAEVEVR